MWVVTHGRVTVSPRDVWRCAGGPVRVCTVVSGVHTLAWRGLQRVIHDRPGLDTDGTSGTRGRLASQWRGDRTLLCGGGGGGGLRCLFKTGAHVVVPSFDVVV